MEALESGAIECPQMPHEETIAVMKLMDRLRDDWGLKLVGNNKLLARRVDVACAGD